MSILDLELRENFYNQSNIDYSLHPLDILTKVTVCYHILTRQDNLLPVIRSDVVLNCFLVSQTEGPDCANSESDLNNNILIFQNLLNIYSAYQASFSALQ